MSEASPNSNENRWPLITILFLCLLILIGFFIGWPLYLSVRKSSDISASQSLIDAVATSISTYQLKTWTWKAYSPEQALTTTKTYHLWDLNFDGYVDGVPAEISSELTDGGYTLDQIRSGYQGFVTMVKPNIPKYFLLKNLQPINAWKQRLRISFAAKIYGNDSFCVWSTGPDGVIGTPDDLVSTKPKIIPPATPAAVP